MTGTPVGRPSGVVRAFTCRGLRAPYARCETHCVRGFLIGLALLAGVAVPVLALRPGGLSHQLRLAARRFRIVLILGGIYVLTSAFIRLAFTNSLVTDYAPPALAIVLAGIFLFIGGDPTQPAVSKPSSRAD